MEAKVYGIPGSHPVLTAELMLARKGIGFKRVDLPTGAIRLMLPRMGFDSGTVPAVKLGDRRLQTTLAISRALDEIVPDPPLFPADPGLRLAVEEAERWGDDTIQSVARRLSYAVLARNRSQLRTFIVRPVMGLPPAVAALTAAPLLAVGRRLNAVTDESTRADLAGLPAQLDHVDKLIAEGVIGGAEPNAADFQIFPTYRLLMTFADLQPLIAGRPAVEAARRVVPQFAGVMPAALPPEWLPATS